MNNENRRLAASACQQVSRLGSVVALAFTGISVAQTTAAPAADELSEIVITGTRIRG